MLCTSKPCTSATAVKFSESKTSGRVRHLSCRCRAQRVEDDVVHVQALHLRCRCPAQRAEVLGESMARPLPLPSTASRRRCSACPSPAPSLPLSSTASSRPRAGYGASAAAAKHGESKTMLFTSKPCTLAAASSTASRSPRTGYGTLAAAAKHSESKTMLCTSKPCTFATAVKFSESKSLDRVRYLRCRCDAQRVEDDAVHVQALHLLRATAGLTHGAQRVDDALLIEISVQAPRLEPT